VKPYSPESDPRPADIGILQSLAASSGGRFSEVSDIDRVLRALDIRDREEERVSYRSLWNTPWAIACLVMLLAVEWIVRKVRNMA
jgi:hypothetical protein